MECSIPYPSLFPRPFPPRKHSTPPPTVPCTQTAAISAAVQTLILPQMPLIVQGPHPPPLTRITLSLKSNLVIPQIPRLQVPHLSPFTTHSTPTLDAWPSSLPPTTLTRPQRRRSRIHHCHIVERTTSRPPTRVHITSYPRSPASKIMPSLAVMKTILRTTPSNLPHYPLSPPHLHIRQTQITSQGRLIRPLRIIHPQPLGTPTITQPAQKQLGTLRPSPTQTSNASRSMHSMGRVRPALEVIPVSILPRRRAPPLQSTHKCEEIILRSMTMPQSTRMVRARPVRAHR